MPYWKLRIFCRAVNVRMVAEGTSAEEIVAEYTKLTEKEKQEVLDNLEKFR